MYFSASATALWSIVNDSTDIVVRKSYAAAIFHSITPKSLVWRDFHPLWRPPSIIPGGRKGTTTHFHGRHWVEQPQDSLRVY